MENNIENRTSRTGVENNIENNKSSSESSTNKLCDIYIYITCGRIPAYVKTKTERQTFKRRCMKYFVEGGHLYHKRKVKDCLTSGSVEVVLQVVINEIKRQELIKLTHEGADCGESTTLASHRGVNATQSMIAERFYWPSFSKDIRTYITNCKGCQFLNTDTKSFPKTTNSAPKVHPVPFPDNFSHVTSTKVACNSNKDGFSNKQQE